MPEREATGECLVHLVRLAHASTTVDGNELALASFVESIELFDLSLTPHHGGHTSRFK